MTGGDVVGRGDDGRAKPRIVDAPADERLDPQYQGALPGLRRYHGVDVELMRQQRHKQVEQNRRQPRNIGVPVLPGIRDQAYEELLQQGTDSRTSLDAHREEPIDAVRGYWKLRLGNAHRQKGDISWYSNGRELSKIIRSCGPYEASRPAWATRRSPRRTSDISYFSGSERRISFAVRRECNDG